MFVCMYTGTLYFRHFSSFYLFVDVGSWTKSGGVTKRASNILLITAIFSGLVIIPPESVPEPSTYYFFERLSTYSGESVWRSVPVSSVYLCLFTLFILILWVHHFIMVSECFVVLCFIGDECFFYFLLILFLFVDIFFMDWCFLFCFYFFLLLYVWCDVGCVRKLLCRSIG